MGQIRIRGTKKFIKTTKDALNLLKEKDPINYRVVIRNIGAIVEHKLNWNSYFNGLQEVPTAFINKKTYTHNLEWYACGIVHEAYHSKLYHDAILDGIDPIPEYSGYHAEMYCLTKQIQCMRRIGASKEDIDWAIECYDRRWWEEDYKKEKRCKNGNNRR